MKSRILILVTAIFAYFVISNLSLPQAASLAEGTKSLSLKGEYDFSYLFLGEMNLEAQFPLPRQHFGINIGGTMAVNSISHPQFPYILAFDLVAPIYNREGGIEIDISSSLNHLTVYLNQDLDIERSFLSKPISAAALNVVSDLVAQLDLPKLEHYDHSVNRTESDRKGQFIADYQISAVGESLHIDKSKSDYRLKEDLARLAGQTPPKFLSDSHILFTASDLLSVKFTEVFSILSNDQLLQKEETTIKIKRLQNTGYSRKPTRPDKQTLISAQDLKQGLEKRLQQAMAANQLGSDTYEELYTKISSLDQGTTISGGELALLLAKLDSFFLLNPDQIPKIAGSIKELEPKSRSFKMQVASLALVGSPEAQRGLLEIARATNPQGKHEVYQELRKIKVPLSETLNTLKAEVFNPTHKGLMTTAALSLGTIASNLKETNKAMSLSIINPLIEHLKSTSNERLLVSVIGNVQMKEYLEDLVPYFQSSSREVKADAYLALRLIDTEEARNHLLSGLSTETEPLYLAVILDALSFHPLSPAHHSRLMAAYTNTNDTTIKKKALLLLNQYSRSSSSIEFWLKELSQTETNPEIKKLLRQLI